MEDFHKLGFTGAVGSTYVTHVKWDRCPHSSQRLHTRKNGYHTVAHPTTVDSSGRVLTVTEAFSGSMNDKMIIRSDAVVARIRDERKNTYESSI